ncbi:MBL fold metallo-hydrolase [Sphingomonas sp. HDW15A]|uniref:MBL fold metallo-hydrolase n=1 Tax=Sphingomonas sp. HDW15A TaxID=2714942 RepID=UPI0014089308|nr:MBL fold metallo-hydrolase [Sphingomonas sp. HDW15A]QIK95752.1 MBL fold metallo-hydrolase [Sphingomonas sp. HDW15A]
MIVRFWGTRGSLPVAQKAEVVRDKVIAALMAANGLAFETDDEAAAWIDDNLEFAVAGTYGGATSCVEIEAGEEFLICDMGSGLREFGLDAMARCASGHARTYHFFMSHVHWDHIMGFPFFVPGFDPGAKIVIHAGHADAEEALRRQQEEISFPVPFDWLKADISFRTLVPGQDYNIGSVKVSLVEQQHSHSSYGYRFEDAAGKVAVYSTDSEHKINRMDGEADVVAFFREADLVICDTMYSLADTVAMKEDWGHSSNITAIDLCHEAAAKRLALFHHEPTYSDRDIQRMHRESIRYEELTRFAEPLEVICSYDGLEVVL